MKLIYIILFLGFAACSVKSQNLSERELEINLGKGMQRPWEVGSDLGFIESYIAIENFFFEEASKLSKSKQGYLKFYEDYVLTKKRIDFDPLFAQNPTTEFLLLPSNLSYTLYNYLNTADKYDDELLNGIAVPLDSIITEYDFSLEDSRLIVSYLNNINDQDFENKIIYRIPLIALFFVELDSN